MLTTAERTLAREHQTSISALTDFVQSEVAALVMALEGQSPAVVREALLDLVPGVAAKYGDAAAALAMDYYEFAREAAEVPGMYIPTPAPLAPPERFEGSIRWAVGAVVGPEPSFEALGILLGGSVSRAVVDVATDTLVDATVSDSRARGWSRILEPGACKFCRMLADRGGVYTEATARFASHDNCRCSAAPRFSLGAGDRKVSVIPNQVSKRNRNEAERKARNERAKKYIAANYPD
ncbi:MAG TPA: hypothetical protein VK028_15490 [Micromonosporaceae bacterium]|nr:hypothetical protein [Micromonosporaceae bacterium]